MSFTKRGSIFTITQSNQIKTANDWTSVVEKTSTAEGVIIHNNNKPEGNNSVVCEIDLENYIYIHTTIMASVTLEPESDYWITKDTEKYINTNGDAWKRDILLNDYPSFIENGVVYVEHDQNPERAKGKVLDAIARDMGDTILIDLLFCVDRRHEDLVHNIETGIANAVSMGCTTRYTICSICGNVAHDEKEYCVHVKNYKNQYIKCADGVYRKCCELCFENTFYDCSIVANPAFAGAVFRKLVASDQVSSQLLANMICKKINSGEYENELMKVASVKTASHPIENNVKNSYEVEDQYADIPYRDSHNVKRTFEEQQSKTKKKASKCADYGSLVILNDLFHVPSTERHASMQFNFIAKDTVGRLIGREGNSCAIYFAKMGMIRNIPSKLVAHYTFQPKQSTSVNKQAKKISDDDLVVNRKGIFLDGDRFQILKVNTDSVEVRWLSGEKIGQKEEVAKKEFTDSKMSWTRCSDLAKFSAIWDGKAYQLKTANWNEKRANTLDQFESHIDNIQHDITYTMPRQKGKYSKSFNVITKFASSILNFNTKIAGDNLEIDVKCTEW